jgi:hypothetical protein
MLDMSGHDATRHDELHSMTLDELETRVAAAGVLISRRQLARHCEKGTFEAKKLPAVNNVDTWFIIPASVEKGIADIKTLQEQRARRDASRPDMTGHDGIENAEHNKTDTSGHDATRPDMTGYVTPEKPNVSESDTSGHDGLRRDMSDNDGVERGARTYPDNFGRVTLLEMQIDEKNKQIADKDSQIEFLKEELTDRRDQIRGMKEIISEQKSLLETLVTPVFKAIAKSVEGTALNPGPIKAPTIDVTPGREVNEAPQG